MSRDRRSLQYELMQALSLQDVKNNSTRKSLTTDIKAFAGFCKETGVRKLSDIVEPVAIVQAYANRLVADGHYSAGSIHRKLAAPCRALEINMGDIDKPKRTQSTITRGRRVDGEVKRGDREQLQPRYSRLVQLQSVVGIRRSELAHLRGRDLQRDECGYLCVHVQSGKGGKEQLQRILPADERVLREIFEGVQPDQRVFSREEMSNHINLHGLRAGQGQRAYEYYAARLQADPEYATQLIKELAARYRTASPHGEHPGAVGRWFSEMFGYCKLSDISCSQYILRGENKSRALAAGRPVTYNRLALLAVSVYHLSHWRLDVTVTNYLLASSYIYINVSERDL